MRSSYHCTDPYHGKFLGFRFEGLRSGIQKWKTEVDIANPGPCTSGSSKVDVRM